MPKKGEPGFDKLYKIRPFIDGLKTKFKQYYSPTKEQSVDESMVKFKGRSSFKQYLPNKPIKRGYKIWVRADQYGYICDFDVYTGKEEATKRKQEELSLGEFVVRKMTKGLEQKGYHV